MDSDEKSMIIICLPSAFSTDKNLMGRKANKNVLVIHEGRCTDVHLMVVL
jgi:hypothetical protein